MAMIVVTDNLNRDYMPITIIEIGLEPEEASTKAKALNTTSDKYSSTYYDIRPNDWINPMESIYDVTDEIPTYEQACKMFGIDLLGEEKAKQLYKDKYYR